MISRSFDFMGRSSSKFGVHCGSDVIILICHVISQDHLIKDDATSRQELIKVRYHSVKFGGHRHSGIVDIVILVCHVISLDHAIKGSCAFTGRGLSR